MKNSFRSSRAVIVRIGAWTEAKKFYGTVLGFPIASESETLISFETGAFRLYVEKGNKHGPVFDFLVPDVQWAKHKVVAARCTLVEDDAVVPRCYLRDPYGLVFNLGRAD